jgi:serine/threonine-protein kinase HipA
MFAYSYEQVFQTMRLLHLTYPEAEQMFRRMVFNVLATNCDDQTKNFSFRLKKGERWQLAPAYDVCFAYDPTNHWVSQQTLSINGKRSNFLKEDFMIIAKENNIKKGEQILEEINQTVGRWENFAIQAKVDEKLMKHIQRNLHSFKQ